jgi:hypothetical protein
MKFLNSIVALLLCSATAGAAELFVAPNGSDDAPGTAERPFATLGRARDAVRAKIVAGLDADVTVRIGGGTYRFDETLVLGPEDSAGPHKITYAAAPNEKVVISGGRVIAGWKRAENGCWTAEVPEVRQGKWWFRQLWADGRRLPRARWPQGEKLTIKTVGDGVKRIGFQQKLPGAALAGKDAELVVIQNWSIARGIVTGSGEDWVQTATPMGYVGHPWTTANPGKRAYLEHAPQFLDEPGEWYLNRKTGLLTYRADEGEDPNKLEFVAPVLGQLLAIRGTAERPVANVRFEGIEFAHTTWALPKIGYAGIQAAHYGDLAIKRPTYAVPLAVELEHGTGCGFTACRVKHTGASGIGLGAGCRENEVVGCEIDDVGANGLMVGWRPVADKPPRQWFDVDWDDPRDVPTANVIANCYVHRCGQQMFGAVGIYDAFARGTKIVHNLVSDLPYTGISIGFRWDPTPTSQRETLVAQNHIHDVMKVVADGGGIYTLGLQPGTVLRGNLIYDVHRSPYTHGGAPNNGIFFDEGSKGLLVEGNVIHGTSGAPIRFNQNAQQWHTWKDNSFGVKPGEPGFPAEAAQEAGLEPEWKERLKPL